MAISICKNPGSISKMILCKKLKVEKSEENIRKTAYQTRKFRFKAGE